MVVWIIQRSGHRLRLHHHRLISTFWIFLLISAARNFPIPPVFFLSHAFAYVLLSPLSVILWFHPSHTDRPCAKFNYNPPGCRDRVSIRQPLRPNHQIYKSFGYLLSIPRFFFWDHTQSGFGSAIAQWWVQWSSWRLTSITGQFETDCWPRQKSGIEWSHVSHDIIVNPSVPRCRLWNRLGNQHWPTRGPRVTLTTR